MVDVNSSQASLDQIGLVHLPAVHVSFDPAEQVQAFDLTPNNWREDNVISLELPALPLCRNHQFSELLVPLVKLELEVGWSDDSKDGIQVVGLRVHPVSVR